MATVGRGAGLAASVLFMIAVILVPQVASTATVAIAMRNNSFETGGANATASGWTDYSVGGDVGAAYTELGGHAGRYRLSHWGLEDYQVETYQYQSGMQNGTYTLWAWVRSSGGQTSAYVALRNCGGAEARTTVPPSASWRRISVSTEVTSRQCTVSLVSEGKARTWANFDDLELVRTGDAPRGSGLLSGAGLGIGMLVLVAALLATGLTIGSRRALRPVHALARGVRRLAAGQRWEQQQVPGNDDVAELARTFNTMAASLKNGEERQRRMVADVAHELRTPLSTVRSHLEALIDGVLPANPAVFASLHEEAMLQQRIVDDLQDLALAEAGELTYRRDRVDVRELLTCCQRALQVQAQRANVRLVLDATGSPEVNADADRIRQVIGNLVGNALRYTPAGGSITLSCRAADDTVVIEVSDTGCGIAPDDLPHVFDRFWRASSSRRRTSPGSGLGLAIARQIVTDHGGEIGVRSRPGVGTTFTMRLPRAAAGAVTGPAAAVGTGTHQDRP